MAANSMGLNLSWMYSFDHSLGLRVLTSPLSSLFQGSPQISAFANERPPGISPGTK